jgi:hypothetical protein
MRRPAGQADSVGGPSPVTASRKPLRPMGRNATAALGAPMFEGQSLAEHATRRRNDTESDRAHDANCKYWDRWEGYAYGP